MLREQHVFRPNTLYHGDCLEVMKRWEAGCVDLIYLDPPFNSNANYNILYGKDSAGKARDEPAQFTAFKDTWFWNADAGRRVQEISRAAAHPAHRAIKGLAEMLPETGMLAYLVYMAERIAALHRVLKDTGSIYLHCDPTASHYLKTIMDCVFGAKNFRNEIVWYYFKPHSSKVNYPKNYDNVLFYTKSNRYSFNHEATLFEYDEKSVKRYDKTDKHGRKYKKYFAKDGVERIAYLKSGRSDNVFKIPFIQGTSKERLGYPTQKPIALLKRI
ncbi:MAG: site-specific DNA-methyltransferase, partial [Gammaproteobacteria bacterium]|nr:site-specific DNA-methyltransferase [Gammaproteobacteria bacterium]